MFGNEENASDGISGEWEWYLTSGGWGTHIEADTAGYDITLKIYNQKWADWFRNGTLVQKYAIREDTRGRLVMYHLNGDTTKVDCGFRIDHHPEINELHLPSARCTDVPVYYFKRK